MKIIFVFMGCLLFLTACTSLENKAVGIGSGVDAFKLETAGGMSTGTFLPNIIAGGAVNTLATAPAVVEGTQTQVVYVHAKRSSFFGELFGIDASTTSTSYIGGVGETAAQTKERFEGFALIEKGTKDETSNDAP